MSIRDIAVALLLLLSTAPVGAVVPLTGRYGAGGAQVRAGYELAVEAINTAGGVSVAGKKLPLELRILDDESDATKTVARLETLASEHVVAYLGGFGSDLHAAAAPSPRRTRSRTSAWHSRCTGSTSRASDTCSRHTGSRPT